MNVLTLTALVIAWSACAPDSQPAPPPAPAPATPHIAIDPRIAACARETDAHHRVMCLGQTEADPALDRLLELARRELPSTGGDWLLGDAADEAGMLAAKVGTARLEADVTTGDSIAQRFGLLALASTIRALRDHQGYGGDRDDRALASALPRVGPICRDRLHATADDVVIAATTCVAKVADPHDAAALVAAIERGDPFPAVVSAALAALRDLPPVDSATLRPLTRFLDDPLPADAPQDAVSVRRDVCDALLAQLDHTDTWVHKHALALAAALRPRDEAAAELCARVATMTDPAPRSRPPFPDASGKSCRAEHYGTLGPADVCLHAPAADHATYKLEVVRDDNPAQPLMTAAVHANAGEFIPHDFFEVDELAAGTWLIVVPVLAGVPERYTAEHAQLLVFDTSAMTIKLAQTTAACRHDNCSQVVRVERRNGDDAEVDIVVRGDVPQHFVWDGHAIQRAR